MEDKREAESAFEFFVAELSTRFTGLSGDQIAVEIERALQELVETLGTDRATLFEFSDDSASLRPIHSWARAPFEPETTPAMRANYPWAHGQLVRGQILRFERLPDEAPGEEARADAMRSGIKSVLTIPIAVGNRFVCALSTASLSSFRMWSDATESRVRTIGQILATAIHRQRTEAVLSAQIVEIRRLQASLEAENAYLRAEVAPAADFEGIVGQSPAIRTALARASQVAPLNTTVLLLGETGTGKELLARAIHELSPRRDHILVKVNCAALPPTLIESELFGHEKGAFTGATATRSGRFELAHQGTLFLDEIGELPLDLQPKLLRVLQDGQFERVGGTRTHQVDARVIAATNRDLLRAIAESRFREDLYYRLAVFPMLLPALRERREDIPLLVWSIVERRGRELGRKIERVPRRVMDALVSYDWPGNVRELENVIERALILATGSTLHVEEPITVAARPAAERLDAIERQHILRVLDRCGWRIHGQGNAAALLGLRPSTLRSRMQKLGIRRPARPPQRHG